MLDRDAAEALRDRISDKWLVDRILDIDEVAERLPSEEFHEPVSISSSGGKGFPGAENLDSAYLTGWSRHMAYSMRVRLRALEPGVIGGLAGGRILAAQVLLRSHLEASSMAVLCLNTVRLESAHELSGLIPQTLFGTALFKLKKRDERIAEMLSYSSTRTITIRQAIDALQRFAYPDGGLDNISVLYSLLCEAAHPNLGGTKHFFTAREVSDQGEFGWSVTYSSAEVVPQVALEGLLELLLLSMSAGYGATELLRNMQFVDGSDGLRSRVPDEIGRSIWDNFLVRAKPPG